MYPDNMHEGVAAQLNPSQRICERASEVHAAAANYVVVQMQLRLRRSAVSV